MAAGFVGQVAALGVPRVSIVRFPLTDHQSHLTIVAVPGVPNCRPPVQVQNIGNTFGSIHR
jgi:hypothetical protein